MAWRYTVSVPLWINGKDTEGENIVLYRINVILQSMDAAPSAQPPRAPFFVLRRFNHFRQLYEQLKAQQPDVMRERGMAPPPKHALHLGGQKEMQDRRREELERWLWRLISKPELARSQSLRQFLEFDRALARFQQQQPRSMGGSSDVAPSAETHTPPRSEIGDFDDGHSEASGYSMAPSSTFSHLQPSGAPLQPPVGSMERQVPAPAAASTPNMRLGFKLETRGDVRKLVDMLEQRLAQAGKDMQAAVAEMSLLSEANRMMGQRVVELEGVLQGGRSAREVQLEQELQALQSTASTASSTARDVELEAVAAQLAASEDIRMEVSSRLAEAEAQLVEMRAAAGEARGRLEEAEGRAAEAHAAHQQTQSQLGETSTRLADLEATSSSKAAMLSQQISSLQQQLAGAHEENKELFTKLREWGSPQPASHAAPPLDGLDEPRVDAACAPAAAAAAAAEAAEQLAAAELQASEARSRAEAAEAQVHALQERAVREREKVRENQVLLAREIKKLRAELSAATQAQAHVEEEHQHQQAPESGAALQALSEQLARREAAAQEDAARIQALQQQLDEQQQLQQQQQQQRSHAVEGLAGAAATAAVGLAQGEGLACMRCKEWDAQVEALQGQVAELREELAAAAAAAAASVPALEDEKSEQGVSGRGRNEERGQAAGPELGGVVVPAHGGLAAELEQLRVSHDAVQGELQAEVARLREQLHGREAEVASLQQGLEAQIVRLQEGLHGQEAEVARLQEALRVREAEVMRLQEELLGREAEVVRLQEGLHGRGAEVMGLQEATRLQEELHEQRAKVVQLQEGMQGREAELLQLQERLHGREAEVARLQEEIAAQLRHAEQLEAGVGECQAELGRAMHELRQVDGAGVAAAAAFEQEKRAVADEAGAASREAQLVGWLAAAKAELEEEQQQRRRQEQELEGQMEGLRRLLGEKERGLAEAAVRVEEVTAAAAAAAAAREAELGVRLTEVEAQLAAVSELAAARAAAAREAARLADEHACTEHALQQLRQEAGRSAAAALDERARAEGLAAERLLVLQHIQRHAPAAVPTADGNQQQPEAGELELVSGLQAIVSAYEASNTQLSQQVASLTQQIASLQAAQQQLEVELQGAKQGGGDPAVHSPEAKQHDSRQGEAVTGPDMAEMERLRLEAARVRGLEEQLAAVQQRREAEAAAVQHKLEVRDAELAALQQRLAVLMTVDEQCKVLEAQVLELRQLQQRLEQQEVAVAAAAVPARGPPSADLLSLLDAPLPAPSPTARPVHQLSFDGAAPAAAADFQDDLVLDLSGFSIGVEAARPPAASSSAGSRVEDKVARAAAVAAAVQALESDAKAVMHAAVDEAAALLRKVREAEQRAAHATAAAAAAVASMPPNAATADSAVDALLAAFADIGAALGDAAAASRGPLREPCLLAPASPALRAAELQVRGCLADTLLELTARGSALNEARCDKMLAAIMSAAAAAATAPHHIAAAPAPAPAPAPPAALPRQPSLTRPVASTAQPPAAAYQPPSFIAPGSAGPRQQPHYQQQQQQGGLRHAPAALPVAPNLLGAFGQRMSETMTSHLQTFRRQAAPGGAPDPSSAPAGGAAGAFPWPGPDSR